MQAQVRSVIEDKASKKHFAERKQIDFYIFLNLLLVEGQSLWGKQIYKWVVIVKKLTSGKWFVQILEPSLSWQVKAFHHSSGINK